MSENGTFQPPTTYGSGAPAGFGGSVAAADVNGDGVLDLVDANGDPPKIVTASSSSTPSGWVTFKDGAKTISTGKLSGGRALLSRKP